MMGSSINLADLDLFESGAPWPVFKELRENDPLHWSDEEAPNHGFWSVTKYHDIVSVLRDPATFTSERFTNLEEVDAEQEEARRSLLETDGSRHRALRRLLQGQFTPAAVAHYETFLRGLTATTLDNAFAKGEFDFVTEVAADFPINVLAKLLDVPAKDNRQLIDWGNRMIGFDDPEHADILISDPDSEKFRLVPFRSPAALEVFAYGDALAKERRGKNGNDLISVLVNGEMSDGIPLSERDFHTNFLLLVVAGNETTRHTITHTMINLIQHPEQLARLQEDPELIPWAVEEFLRFGTHNSTHVDAPWHYNSETGGKPSQTIDELPLEWFHAPGVRLDFTSHEDGDAITADQVRSALQAADHELKPLDIVLVHTGRDEFLDADDYMIRGPGVTAEATHWMYEQGVRVMGIDAWGWDRPLHLQAAEAVERNESGIFWAAHQADLAYSQIERLANLAELPPTGFTVACFPLKVVGGSAGPARVVGIVED